MNKGILARKLGMTQVFNEQGELVPVTVLEAGPCEVLQKKTEETDGYRAIQVGFLGKKQVNKPLAGHFKQAGVSPKRYIREFRIDDVDSYEVGQQLRADLFEKGEHVDVIGISRGKGFAGAVKRWGHHRGPMAHGSNYHRRPGSLGAMGPARVFKGHKLPGRMGGKRTTVQNLEVVDVDPDRSILLVRGAVPGPNKGLVLVRDTVKSS